MKYKGNSFNTKTPSVNENGQLHVRNVEAFVATFS